MSRVFVLEPPNHRIDLTPAKEHGELVLIFGPSDRRPSVFKPTEFVTEVRTMLDMKGFNPEEDLFCMAGGLINIALALSAISHHDEVKLLLFDATDHKYVVRTLRLKETS